MFITPTMPTMPPCPLIIPYKLAYKSARNCVIALRLEKCKTNENRSNVFDAMHATFRCDKAFVIDISNKFTNESIVCIASDHDNFFIYERNKYVTVDNFDNDINKICTRGIHYYVSYEAAFFMV